MKKIPWGIVAAVAIGFAAYKLVVNLTNKFVPSVGGYIS